MEIELVKKLAERLESEIKQDLTNGNHHVILKTNAKIETLAECKMILEAYEGCPKCFHFDCRCKDKE